MIQMQLQALWPDAEIIKFERHKDVYVGEDIARVLLKLPGKEAVFFSWRMGPEPYLSADVRSRLKRMVEKHNDSNCST